MAQININTDAELERDLRRLMKARGFKHKSEAIRVAVHEAAERASHARGEGQFAAWIGLGLSGAKNPTPRFHDDDDLWETKR